MLHSLPSIAMHTLSRRERQKLELRTRILDAARELLLAHGLEGFSMRKLAAKIDYTATAIYFHFPDKESLLLELLAGDFLAFRAALGQLPAELDPLLRLRFMGRGYIEFGMAHPLHYRLLFMTPGLVEFKRDLDQQLAQSTEPSDQSQAKLISHDTEHPLAYVQLSTGQTLERGNPAQDAYAFLVETVRTALAQNYFRAEFQDADLLAQIIWSSVHGLVSLRIAKGNDCWIDWRSLAQTTGHHVDAMLRGVVQNPQLLDLPLPTFASPITQVPVLNRE